MTMARVTITGPATTRSDVSNRTGKPYTITTQPATLETKAMRVPFDLDLPSAQAEKDIGTVWNWDVESDLVMARFGPELKRYPTLSPASAAAPAKTA